MGRGGRILLGDFVADYFETEEAGAAEGGGEGAIGGVAAYGHEDAADAGDVVAGVESPPAVAEIDFEPGAEIHGTGGDDDADVAEISGGVARRDIEGAAEGDCEVLEIAADADTFGVDAESGAGGIGEFIAEGDLFVDPGADFADALPAFGSVAEKFGGGIGE